MKVGDEVKIVTKQSYCGTFYGIVGKVERIWPDNPECPYPYEVSFGDGTGTWPFGIDELEVL